MSYELIIYLYQVQEKELIIRLKKGDQAAFKLLMEKHRLNVVRTCMGFLHDQDDAEDVAQEVFIEAFRNINKFRDESKISTWLYRIAVNKSLNFIRDNKKHKLLLRLSSFFKGNDEDVEIADYNVADKGLFDQDRKNILKAALNKLPENQRTTFVLNKYEELSYKEIAEVMEISLASVESLIHRAKKNLQKILLNYYKNDN